MSRIFSPRFLKLPGAVLALALAGSGSLVQVQAAPTPLNWVQVNSTQAAPPARDFAAISYDSITGRTVLFGGSNAVGGSAFSDTWEWDGTSWVQMAPAVSPPGLVTAAMAYDSGRHVSVLFGGATSSGATAAGTWEWNGTSWAQRAPAIAPPGRAWPAMAYDSDRGVTVLFGGAGQGGALADTWQWDGTAWTQVFPASSPPPRYGASMTFDSVRNRVVLFGGRDNNGRLNDTWEWDGSNWTQRFSTSVPYPRFVASMVFDTNLGRTILFGGDYLRPYALGANNETWEWDGSQWIQDWTATSPIPRLGQSMAYDSARGRNVVFGGADGLGAFYNDTWELGTGIVTAAGNPAVSFSEFGTNFSNEPVGTTSYPAGIILSSTGTGPLVVASISITGDFSISRNDCPVAGNPLAAGSSCLLLVTFTPTAPGTRTGTLVVSDNGPGGSQSLALTGTAIDTDLALTGTPANLTAIATDSSGAVVTYAAPSAVDEAGDGPAPAVSCAPASGSTFGVGTTAVTCTASSADDSPASVSATFNVIVMVDLDVEASVAPSTATTGTLVTGTVSVINAGSLSRTVTLVASFTYLGSTGAVTVSSTKAIVKLDGGQTAIRMFTYRVSKDASRGTYAFAATATDVTGTVGSAATFTIG